MTSKTWSTIFGWLVFLFLFLIPVAITVSVYTTLETTTSQGTIRIIGILIIISLLFGAVRWGKKRIKERIEMGFKVSPYIIFAVNHTFGVIGLSLFTGFIYSVKGEIETLWTVLLFVTISEFIAYILGYIQIHFDKKVLEEESQ